MARQPRRRDWQERAFDVGQFNRRDRSTRALPQLPPSLKSSPDVRRRSSWRFTGIGLAVLIVAIIVKGGFDANPPALTTNCHTPGMALSTTHVRRGGEVRWAATGP